jgi:general secretion pathway protein L
MYATGLRSPFMSLPLVYEVFTWWVAQMRALLLGEAASASRLPDGLIIAIDSLAAPHPAGVLLMRQSGIETILRPIGDQGEAAPSLPRILRLPAGTVLSRDLALPLAAARDLHTVVAYEMTRLTPLTADELLWGISQVTPDRARERVTLRLSIVSRSQVEPLLAALARLGLHPGSIEAERGSIPLDAARRRGQLSLPKLWAWSCAGLAVCCIITPFLRQQMALDAVDRVIAAHQAVADLGESLRRRIAIANSSHAAIARARQAGDALQVLATLTDALPDGTWLNDLSLSGGDVSMDGQSDNAAKLIGLLAAIPALRAPSFTAPVTRSADDKSDQFSLHATVGK